MPQDVIMAFVYTKQALTVTLSEIRSVLWLWEPEYRHREFFNLGHDAIKDGFPEDQYWEYVRQALMEIMVSHQYYPKPGKVLLMGESAADKQFRAVLEKALGSLMDEIPQILAQNAEYIAARGAAELAKRAPYDPRLRAQTTTGDF